ncbi:potassium channel family protein [Fictibacillus nanhaiensis]|uniref:potassium channel family protein n=1 Tax=Fictibacillus nanhaiensis TaxID=742169 RepID=UPI001C96B390|nr:potassium channel family protein [Fictibacillus nanhaiensis]MBY6035031.1 potassium channel family protein [Fictibacillus nanhaiensis]
MRGMYHFYLRLPMLIRLGLILLFILSFSAYLAHLLEQETFPTFFESFYWAVITAGTVGYGDYAPYSLEVRILAIFLVFLGGSFLAFTTVHFASAVIKTENRYFEGKNMYKNQDHIIIVGWNERSRNTIHSIKNRVQPYRIVLIDNSLEANPLYKQGVHFIHGKASEDQIWLKAHIQKASSILITSDASLTESDADMNTIISILTARGLNDNIPIHAEILTLEQATNAKRAGADFIIQTSNLAAQEMVKSFNGSLIQE